MKKVLLLVATLVAAFTLSACTNSDENVTQGEFTSEDALVSMSYLSTGILDTTSHSIQASSGGIRLSSLLETQEAPETEIETEIDEVNVYLDKLKGFIENGPDGLGNVSKVESDDEAYQFKLVIVVEELEYVLYYNIDELTEEISGVFVIGEVEYTIVVEENTLDDKDELECNPDIDNDCDDIDEDNDLEDDIEGQEETEEKMVLVASNGFDTIKITYKREVEEDEEVVKFKLEKNIDGVESEVEIKIVTEEDEYKVVIKDGENEYSFKVEEEDGETMYKLQYEVNGVKGQVKIKVRIDEETGEEYYAYQIIEMGKNRSVEKGKPESFGWDDDEEEPEETEEETEEETDENNV